MLRYMRGNDSVDERVHACVRVRMYLCNGREGEG